MPCKNVNEPQVIFILFFQAIVKALFFFSNNKHFILICSQSSFLFWGPPLAFLAPPLVHASPQEAAFYGAHVRAHSRAGLYVSLDTHSEALFAGPLISWYRAPSAQKKGLGTHWSSWWGCRHIFTCFPHIPQLLGGLNHILCIPWVHLQGPRRMYHGAGGHISLLTACLLQQVSFDEKVGSDWGKTSSSYHYHHHRHQCSVNTHRQ